MSGKKSEAIADLGLEIAAELNHLNDELMNLAQSSLQKAIRMGELLTKQKEQLRHGDWIAWLDWHVKFSQQTANRYMRLYEERNDPKLLTVSNLTDAYKLLAENDLPVVPDRIDPKTVKRRARKKSIRSVRVRERCPTCGRVMTKEILARIRKRKND